MIYRTVEEEEWVESGRKNESIVMQQNKNMSWEDAKVNILVWPFFFFGHYFLTPLLFHCTSKWK